MLVILLMMTIMVKMMVMVNDSDSDWFQLYDGRHGNDHIISNLFAQYRGREKEEERCDVWSCLGIYRLHFRTPTFLPGHPGLKLLFSFHIILGYESSEKKISTSIRSNSSPGIHRPFMDKNWICLGASESGRIKMLWYGLDNFSSVYSSQSV